MRFQEMKRPHPKLDDALEKHGWVAASGFFPYFTREALDAHLAAVEHPTELDLFMSGALAWCQDQFGERQTHWALMGLDFVFERPTDAAAFKIRWC